MVSTLYIQPHTGLHALLRNVCAGILITLCTLFLVPASVQGQVSVNVSLNRKSVYVQQPFHVTVTVYTKTWFTAPVEFGNLQIPNAFIIPFDRTQPGMFTFGGKQYPGIQFYYIVFPYKVGTFKVPSLEIDAESPAEGDYKGRKVVLHTTPQSFTVRDVPEALKSNGAWFVAKNVVLHDNWAPASAQYKVGDVIKRTITIDAYGTLPQFIPNIEAEEKLDWASSYPQEPVLTDTRGGGDANGRSVQTITYLLEKEGEFTAPSVKLSFWNPYTSRMQTVATHPLKLHVLPNPNLGILTTLKDSLDATVAGKAEAQEDAGAFLIMGMPWYMFCLWAAGTLIALFLMIKVALRLWKALRQQWLQYQQSEKYLFRRMLRSGDDPERFLPALYRWWDSFPSKPSASIGASYERSGKKDEATKAKEYFEKATEGDPPNTPAPLKEDMKKYRKERLTKKQDLFQ